MTKKLKISRLVMMCGLTLLNPPVVFGLTCFEEGTCSRSKNRTKMNNHLKEYIKISVLLSVLIQSPVAEALTCPTDSGGTQLGDYCLSPVGKNYWSNYSKSQEKNAKKIIFFALKIA